MISHSGEISLKDQIKLDVFHWVASLVRTIIAKVGISRVSKCNISVIFALSHSDAMLVCWQGVSAPRYGISSPGYMPQGLCLCQKGSTEMS